MQYSNGIQLHFFSLYTLHLSPLFLNLVSIDRTFILWSHYYRFNITKRRQTFTISIIIFILLFTLDSFILSLGIINKNTNQV